MWMCHVDVQLRNPPHQVCTPLAQGHGDVAQKNHFQLASSIFAAQLPWRECLFELAPAAEKQPRRPFLCHWKKPQTLIFFSWLPVGGASELGGGQRRRRTEPHASPAVPGGSGGFHGT